MMRSVSVVAEGRAARCSGVALSLSTAFTLLPAIRAVCMRAVGYNIYGQWHTTPFLLFTSPNACTH
eukprot:355041-Chlamydomonas_euryale.AAC.7